MNQNDRMGAHWDKPVAIWTKEQANLFHAADKKTQEAWNAYANAEARRVNESGILDSYDTVASYHQWAPPLSFSEWLKGYAN